MDFLYKSTMNIMTALAGDNRIRTFSLQKALLNIIGLNWWKGGIDLSLPSYVKHKFYPVFVVFLMFYSSLMTIKASARAEPTNDFEFTKQVNGIILSMTFLASVLKILYFLYLKEDVIRLIEMCEKLGRLEDADDPVEKALRFSVFYGHLLLSNAGTWTSYYLAVHQDVPFATDYPWALDNPWGWTAALVVDFYCGVYCGFGHILVDTIFPMSVSSICGQLHRLRKILKGVGTGYWTDRSTISAAVELHTKLLKVTNQMGKCYSKLFVAQSVYTVLHACILIFAVTKVSDKFAVTMSSVPMLSAAYAQLYLYCSYGQTLTSEFNDLTFAAYNNCWYLCDIRSRKALVLFAEACKRSVSLKGFGNIKASLENYLHSIQESVSYFLILKTVTSKAPDEEGGGEH